MGKPVSLVTFVSWRVPLKTEASPWKVMFSFTTSLENCVKLKKSDSTFFSRNRKKIISRIRCEHGMGKIIVEVKEVLERKELNYLRLFGLGGFKLK